MEDGGTVQGESSITADSRRISRVALQPPEVAAVDSAVAAIMQAEVIILGPGSLYTSVLPNLLVPGIADALQKTKAEVIYICNVMTQPGETDGYSAADHVQAIIDHVGAKIIDRVVVNTQEIAPALCDRYACQQAYPVQVDVAAIEALGPKVVQADLVDESNLVRHDPIKLTRTIIAMVYDVHEVSDRVRLLNQYLLEDNNSNHKSVSLGGN